MAQTATVTLTGRALEGHEPDIAPEDLNGDEAQTVYLGAIIRHAPKRALKLSEFLPRRARVFPTSTHWRDKAKASLSRMLKNDVEGCCVISGKGHIIGVSSANDGPQEKCPTDDEIHQTYQRWKAGPGDSGCIISDVLDRWRDEGMKCQGKVNKIDGWVAVPLGETGLVRAASYLFGHLTIGVSLPGEWTQSDVWDVTNSRIVGGHDVPIIDYDGDGYLLSSWGRIYRLTERAYKDDRFVGEAYIALTPDWYNDDRISQSGLDVEALKAALEEIRLGHEPPDPGPTPPPGPTPTHEKLYLNLEGPLTFLGMAIGQITLTGTAEAEPPQELSTMQQQRSSGNFIDDLIAFLEWVRDMFAAHRERMAREGQSGGEGGHAGSERGGRSVGREDRADSSGGDELGRRGGDDAASRDAGADTSSAGGAGEHGGRRDAGDTGAGDKTQRPRRQR